MIFYKINLTRFLKRGNQFAPLALGFALSLFLLVAFSKGSGSIFDFLLGSFSSAFYFGTMLNTACIFMAGAIGNAIILTTGEYNLGGEGQIYIAGFVSAKILTTAIPIPANLRLPLAFFASLLAPALMMTLSAILKQLKNANVLLTSFLISASIIPFIDFAIAQSLSGSKNNLLALPFIAEKFRSIQLLKPSPLSLVALASPIFCLVAWFVKFKTVLGRKLQITGISKEFSSYCGFPETKIMYGTFLASGVFHGLAGFVAVVGTYYTCHAGFYAGLGWNALSVALLANANPLAIIPSSLLLSWLFASADRVTLSANFGFDISALIQGILLSCIALQYARKK